MMPIQNYTLYGKPARVFPFQPNWASNVTETLEWRTDVLRAFSGKEQRRALRQVPRRSFEYSILVHGEAASMLEAYLWGWQHKYFALPVWMDGVKLNSSLVAGQTNVPMSTTDLSFRDGDYIVVFGDTKTFEVVQVETVFADHLQLSGAGVVNAWAAGTRVYPLVLSHLGTSIQTNRHTSSVMSISALGFVTNPDVTNPFLPNIAPLVMYDGYEVVMHRPNWGTAITNDFSRIFDTVDVGVGPIGYYDHETTSTIVRPIQWLLKSRADIAQFRALAGRLSGQLKTCWIPSWHEDFTLAGDNIAEPSVLKVKGIWFNGMVGVDISRDRLAVTLPNGTTVFRRITAMAPNYTDGMTELQLDSVLGTTVSINDNLRIRLLMRCRLATDKIVIPWHTDRVATPKTAFTTVKL